jgi:hypothetical protein
MKAIKECRTAQRSLFPEWEINEKSAKKGCPPDSQVINSYLKTREGLFRLVTTFPGSMPVGEAVRTFHRHISHGKEVAV